MCDFGVFAISHIQYTACIDGSCLKSPSHRPSVHVVDFYKLKKSRSSYSTSAALARFHQILLSHALFHASRDGRRQQQKKRELYFTGARTPDLPPVNWDIAVTMGAQWMVRERNIRAYHTLSGLATQLRRFPPSPPTQ